jgi:hypothetical protein
MKSVASLSCLLAGANAAKLNFEGTTAANGMHLVNTAGVAELTLEGCASGDFGLCELKNKYDSDFANITSRFDQLESRVGTLENVTSTLSNLIHTSPISTGFTRTDAVFPATSANFADFDLGCTTRYSPGCEEGRSMQNQYSGVEFLSTTNVYNGYSKSPGFGAANGPHSGWGNAPMVAVFDSPQSNVGFYYAGPNSDMSVQVEDTNGAVEVYAITNAPAGVPTDSAFFSVQGSANIKKLTISGAGYMIDDMRWSSTLPGSAQFSRTDAVFSSSNFADFDLGCTTRYSPGCEEGRSMQNQYSGVEFLSTTNVYNGYSKSPGFGAANGPHSGWGNAPMVAVFDSPQSNVGFYYAGPNSDMSVQVEDTNGAVEVYAITNAPAAVPTDSAFFSVQGSANIKKLTISGAGYMIDDMRWN